MWNNQGGYETSGGFEATQSDTPGGGEKKRNRAQNLVPVRVSEILGAPEDGLTIEGRPVGMVEFVGTVKSVDVQASKTTYIIDDDTGSVSAVHWTDGDKAITDGDAVSEGMHARVIGVVRSQKGEKHIMVFRICGVEGRAEVDAHKLEVVYAKMKIKQLVDKENMTIGANPLSNSMVGGFGGATGASSGGAASSGSSFGNPKHEAVFKMLQGCTREEGLHRDELMQGLSGKMSKKDLDDALAYLSDEGHIYSTMDEDHFKTTDA